MSYVEKLREIDALRAALPKREYMTKEEYARLKGNLTRAKNSGDGQKVLKAVEGAVRLFDGKVWPDDWSTWRIALEDAAAKARYKDDDRELAAELEAASLVLFRF